MEVNKDLIKEAGDLVVDSIRTKNMYDMNSDIPNQILNSSGGLTQGTGYVTSQFIKVKPNTDYTISKVVNTSVTDPTKDDTMRIGYFTSSETFISRPTSTNNPYTVTTPSNCEYVRISYQQYVSSQLYVSNVQLEEGSVATSYTLHQNLNPITNSCIQVALSGTQSVTLPSAYSSVKINLTSVQNQVGGSLSFESASNSVVIGENVHHVEVSGSLSLGNGTTNNTDRYLGINKNGGAGASNYVQYSYPTSALYQIVITPSILSVSNGDKITATTMSGIAETLSLRKCSIMVKVID